MPRANGRDADGTLHHRTGRDKAYRSNGVTASLSDGQYNRMSSLCDVLGITKADMLRAAINAYMSAIEKSMNLTYDPKAKEHITSK